jgi:hypothetical protein
VNFQVLDPPLVSFESLCLRSWPRVSVNLGFFSLCPCLCFEKQKKIFTLVFLL